MHDSASGEGEAHWERERESYHGNHGKVDDYVIQSHTFRDLAVSWKPSMLTMPMPTSWFCAALSTSFCSTGLRVARR